MPPAAKGPPDMPQTSILYPAFAHVLLTIVVMCIMAQRRSASMKAKKHDFKDVALGQDVWAEAATKAARNYSNQFEMPVLFFAACAFASPRRFHLCHALQFTENTKTTSLKRKTGWWRSAASIN